jgi:hypothetical protein
MKHLGLGPVTVSGVLTKSPVKGVEPVIGSLFYSIRDLLLTWLDPLMGYLFEQYPQLIV